MTPIAKNKKVDSNTEIENTSVDFNMLSCPEGSINKHNKGDASEWKIDFSTDINNYDSSGTDFFFPSKNFAVL